MSNQYLKKIVIAAGIFPPDVGGPATYAARLAEEMKKEGYEVKVVTYSDKLIRNRKSKFEVKKENLEVIRVARGGLKGWRHLIYLGKVFQATRGARAIYALDATAAGVPAALTSIILRKKLLVRIGGDLLWERAAESGAFAGRMSDFYQSGRYRTWRPFIFRAVKFVLRRAETVFVTAEILKEAYIKYYGIEEKKIALLPNVFVKEKREAELEKIETSGEKRILFAGRFVKYKNLNKLMEVFKDIYERIAPARLVLVGDGPEAEKIEDRCRELKIEEQVTITGRKTKEELRAEIEKASLGVSLSSTEYNPNFILECLAASRPVVTTRENGLSVKLPEMFLTDPFSREETGEKIAAILNNQATARKEAEALTFSYTFEDSVNDFKQKLEQ